MLSAAVIDEGWIAESLTVGKQFAGLLRRHGLTDPDKMDDQDLVRGKPGSRHMLLSVVGLDRLEKMFGKLFDTGEFLSPYGLRALSAYHRDHPYVLQVEGLTATVDYEPAESTTALFGGNSNWRGPVWMPLNYLFVDALARLGEQVGERTLIDYPTGSGVQLGLTAIAADLRARLIALWLPDAEGRRPVFGGVERMQSDPRWRENLLFYEYFNGDDGAGLGASHQTGWTALVADLIVGRGLDPDPSARSLYG
jgi:hypothetical protein